MPTTSPIPSRRDPARRIAPTPPRSACCIRVFPLKTHERVRRLRFGTNFVAPLRISTGSREATLSAPLCSTPRSVGRSVGVWACGRPFLGPGPCPTLGPLPFPIPAGLNPEKATSSRTEVCTPSRAFRFRWEERFAPMERRAWEGGDRSGQSERDPVVGPEQFVPSQRGLKDVQEQTDPGSGGMRCRPLHQMCTHARGSCRPPVPS